MKYFFKLLWTTEHPILASIISGLTTMSLTGIMYMLYILVFIGV